MRGSEKIYNSADKLFELSDRDPMGIMVYNNLEYMGISLEVAIKKFRLKCTHFKSVVEAAEQFFGFLLEELAPDESLQQQHARAILYRDFLFTQVVRRRISAAESASPSKCFSDTSENAIAEFYSDALHALTEEVFDDLALEEEHKTLLMRMGVLLLHPQKKDRSDWWTNRKTFTEEVDEIIAEMRIEVARAVRKVFESPD